MNATQKKKVSDKKMVIFMKAATKNQAKLKKNWMKKCDLTFNSLYQSWSELYHNGYDKVSLKEMVWNYACSMKYDIDCSKDNLILTIFDTDIEYISISDFKKRFFEEDEEDIPVAKLIQKRRQQLIIEHKIFKEIEMMTANDINVSSIGFITKDDPITVTEHPNDILLKKLDECGIDKLHLILKEQFNSRITNIKNTTLALDIRKGKIKSAILVHIIKSDDDDIATKILSLYFKTKPKEKKNTNWINEFDIGEDVLYVSSIYTKAKIIKKNQASLTIQLYDYKIIRDDDAAINQTYGTNRCIWLLPTGEKKIIRSRNSIIKHGEIPDYDNQFIEGEKQVDYGR